MSARSQVDHGYNINAIGYRSCGMKIEISRLIAFLKGEIVCSVLDS